LPPRHETVGDAVVIGSYHNISASARSSGLRLLGSQQCLAQDQPMPNFRGRRFTNAHRPMIWAARDEKGQGYTFNYEPFEGRQQDVQARSDWLIRSAPAKSAQRR